MRAGRRPGPLPQVGPWPLVACVVGLVVLILLVPTQLGGREGSAPPPGGVDQATTPSTTAPPTVAETRAALPAGTAAPSPSPAPARTLSGRALATAWLTGYLSRSSRDDTRWVATIQDITDPDLLTQLQTGGPDAVGLFGLSRWRVTAVTPYDDPQQPVDTPSRQVLAYTATVTDGRTTEQKPFLLYCYRSPGAGWTVSMVEQPYTSEN